MSGPMLFQGEGLVTEGVGERGLGPSGMALATMCSGGSRISPRWGRPPGGANI